MFTDQRQYVKYLQIMSDVICYTLVSLLIVPVTMTIYCDCNALFHASSGFTDNICIYKSAPYVGNIFIIIFLSFLASWAAAMLPFFSSTRIRTGLIVPLLLSLLNGAMLWALLKTLPVVQAKIPLICIVSVCTLFLSTLFNRLNIRLLLQKAQAHQVLIKTCAIAGTGVASQKLARYILDHPETGLRLAGFIQTTHTEVIPHADAMIVGNVMNLTSVIHKHKVGMIIVPTLEELNGKADLLFKTSAIMGIELCCSEKVEEMEDRAYSTNDQLNGDPVFRYKFVYIAPASAFLKRVFDFTGSGLLILLCLPLWIVIPLFIKTDSKGPIFFRQERIGTYGRRFILYKFRSMHEGAERMQKNFQHLNEMDGPAFKIKDDPRQTSAGRILRKYSLDELPQLFNVFKGDISLVGPRPALEDEVLQYRPIERRRLSVIQGITCVWQVSGRNEIKFDEWMKLDLMYIDHWSFVSDIKILYRTVPAVLMKRGAY